jgi:hypothetical protein
MTPTCPFRDLPPELQTWNAGLLRDLLQMAVPLRILALKKKGGPDDTDWWYLSDSGLRIAEHGDTLLFKTTSERARAEGWDSRTMFAVLANALAVLAFVDGGVTMFQLHWEARADS